MPTSRKPLHRVQRNRGHFSSAAVCFLQCGQSINGRGALRPSRTRRSKFPVASSTSNHSRNRLTQAFTISDVVPSSFAACASGRCCEAGSYPPAGPYVFTQPRPLTDLLPTQRPLQLNVSNGRTAVFQCHSAELSCTSEAARFVMSS